MHQDKPVTHRPSCSLSHSRTRLHTLASFFHKGPLPSLAYQPWQSVSMSRCVDHELRDIHKAEAEDEEQEFVIVAMPLLASSAQWLPPAWVLLMASFWSGRHSRDGRNIKQTSQAKNGGVEPETKLTTARPSFQSPPRAQVPVADVHHCPSLAWPTGQQDHVSRIVPRPCCLSPSLDQKGGYPLSGFFPNPPCRDSPSIVVMIVAGHTAGPTAFSVRTQFHAAAWMHVHASAGFSLSLSPEAAGERGGGGAHLRCDHPLTGMQSIYRVLMEREGIKTPALVLSLFPPRLYMPIRFRLVPSEPNFKAGSCAP
ncbi:hypothetical protein B0I35DRAFT_435094 [Stachybotrys elegans]|uniref:Uncharacterized protein n=1 Tax=Stachybotrys elegans TaxID=80388 RepID=A0A8K0SRI3_9HYPO|nr:hypothetical protein B0I35DRAFT_435094 [Stachybotrys elegans]